jgi:ABC-2 type transport system ATP-binding protein
MTATIEVSGLRKRYGATLALDGMTFTAAPGVVTGFVGPNGAGKSTTMRVLLGLDRADEGSALIGGRRYPDLRTPCIRAGPAATTCCGSRTRRAWARSAPTRSWR